MGRRISRLFRAFWPLGLFIFYLMIVLSFTDIGPELLAQIFGAAVIACAAVAWLIVDWVKPSEHRVRSRLKDMEDLLKPYEGLSLREMPPEVQAEVRLRLGWSAAESPLAPLPPAPLSGPKA